MSKSASAQSINTTNLEQLQTLADHKLTQLIKKYPAFTWLLTNQSRSLDSQIHHASPNTIPDYQAPPDSQHPSPVIASVATEEVRELFIKLRSIITNHQLWQDNVMRLYLEQHITDLVGYSVTSQIDQVMIPVWHGRVMAISHQKRSLADTLVQHRSHLEAGLSRDRLPLSSIHQPDDLIGLEQYAVHYPLWLLQSYQTSPTQAFDQIRQYKWLLINPVAEKLVVGETAGVLPPTHRYGVGLSPELVRLGRFWWPGMSGDTLCLLIDQHTPSGLLYG